MKTVAALAVAGLSIAAPAQAVTFFSLGGAPDQGVAPYETMLVTFDAPHAAGIVETDSGTVTLQSGSSGSAAAPAGDATVYQALGADGIATFDFTGYFAAQGGTIKSLSVYLGSIDTYNKIEVLDSAGSVLKTIVGADLPGNNGDQGAAITNRRLYINFLPSEDVKKVRFSATGVAFEYDSIAASTHYFNLPDGATPDTLPAVPEPASWALMIAGFGLTGAALRRRPLRATSAI